MRSCPSTSTPFCPNVFASYSCETRLSSDDIVSVRWGVNDLGHTSSSVTVTRRHACFFTSLTVYIASAAALLIAYQRQVNSDTSAWHCTSVSPFFIMMSCSCSSSRMSSLQRDFSMDIALTSRPVTYQLSSPPLICKSSLRLYMYVHRSLPCILEQFAVL